MDGNDNTVTHLEVVWWCVAQAQPWDPRLSY